MTTKIPFERAMADHGPTVLRVCTAVLGPGPDAEDAYSEAFLSALRRWPDLADDTNVEAWLVRVAQRKAVDVIRARARRAIPSAAVPDREPTVTDDAEVWHVVAKLPERQRLAVAYHYLGGLPHTETAELTGSTPAAVRRAAADGIKALRSALADHSKDTP
ncbi:RNA polymerase sigma24 factor [Mycolicibacterium arabiense]|uniref:RNA polymerase sigma24 factor n=1 Tax=Mycolicibacterium arabiense TaxID=1286181 RepID=A0A7I7RZD6_9MYCO|nr:sigma-70 family RNA polymerase sigma factor [Mycolicibacterium arabiense]MCV7371307.1 sigma-70 family RNA polymerase sigma factor [Mycolicibacterium arabiense]BBY50008.1 RNA polymerase sigma24 factor [Mycolicibacterium arabiense]